MSVTLFANAVCAAIVGDVIAKAVFIVTSDVLTSVAGENRRTVGVTATVAGVVQQTLQCGVIAGEVGVHSAD